MTRSIERIARWAIIGLVGLAAVFVTFDFGGSVRSVVALLAVLVAPGLAASMWIDTMSADLRVAVAATASSGIFVLATTAATLIGASSGDFVFFVIASITIALAILPAIRGPARQSDMT